MEDLRLSAVAAMNQLIETHQTKPGNYFRAIQERLVSEEDRFSRLKEEEQQEQDLLLDFTSESTEEPLDRVSETILDGEDEEEDLLLSKKDLIGLDQDDKSSGFGSMNDDSSECSEVSTTSSRRSRDLSLEE